MLPKDPLILLSIINMKLRDYYSSLEDLCKAENYDLDEVITRLSKINYSYEPEVNQFK